MVQKISGLTGYRDEIVTDALSLGGEGTLNGLKWLGSDSFGIFTADSEVARFDSSGNLGVGISTPFEKLDVNGNIRITHAEPTLIIRDNNSSGVAQRGKISFADNGLVEKASIGLNQNSDSNLYIENVDGDVIIPNGNVGLGTSSPSAKLDINTPLNGDTLRVGLLDNQPTAARMFQGVDDYFNISTVNNSERITLGNTNTNPDVVMLGGDLSVGSSALLGNRLEVRGTSQPMLNMYSEGETALRATYSAIEGLLLTSYQSTAGSPNTKTADIVANADGTAPSELRLWTKEDGSAAASPRVAIDSSGNLGLGNTNPGTYNLGITLAVGNTSSDNAGISIVTNDTGTARLRFSDSSLASAGYILYEQDEDLMHFGVAGGSEMYLSSVGNIGLGNSSPTLANADAGAVFVATGSTRAGFRATAAGGDVELRTFGAGAQLINYANGELRFGTNALERMRITSDGTLQVSAPPNSGVSSLVVNAQDNTPKAVSIVQGSNNYFDIDTTNTIETITLGNAVTNPRLILQGNVGVGNTNTNTALSIRRDTVSSLTANNALASLQLINGTGSYTADDIIGSIGFTKSASYGSDQRAAVVAYYSDTGSLSSNIGTELGFRTSEESATNSVEHMRITSTGSVAVGTSGPASSAKFEVSSITQGFLPPRMTTTQRDNISSPAAGLVVYNTTTNKHQGYDGTSWNDFY